MTKSLSLLCLALLAAPLSAQTVEQAKSASDGALASIKAPKISDVCFGKGGLVARTYESIGKAEKDVAGKIITVGEGVELVMKNVESGNGQCVAKTVLSYLSSRGDIASSITVEDNGKAISIMLSTNGGPVLFKGASEAGAYAFQVLTYRLQRIAEPADASGGSCGQAYGKDADQRSCQRHGYEKYGDAEITASPWPSAGEGARGGKDGDQISEVRRADPHE